MTARVTMRDVARAAGVSPMTVSRTLKGDGKVNPETALVVRQVADRLGYVYDSTAQAFRAQRSGFVAVTLPSINNANFATTHRALTEALAETGLQILLGITNYSIEDEERLVRQLLARRPEAIVLTGGTHSDATRTLIEGLEIPVIEIWDIPPKPLGAVVGFSNGDAMGLIVAHLAQRGRRRLAFVGASGDTDHRGAARRDGVILAARALGLAEVAVIEAGPAPVSMAAGADAVKVLGRKIADFDALVCVSDPVAFGAMTACQAMGLSVPGEIAVTGFGAFEVAMVCHPALTTVDVDAAGIGRLAGERIVRLIGGEASLAGILRTDVKLVPGQSS